MTTFGELARGNESTHKLVVSTTFDCMPLFELDSFDVQFDAMRNVVNLKCVSAKNWGATVNPSDTIGCIDENGTLPKYQVFASPDAATEYITHQFHHKLRRCDTILSTNIRLMEIAKDVYRQTIDGVQLGEPSDLLWSTNWKGFPFKTFDMRAADANGAIRLWWIRSLSDLKMHNSLFSVKRDADCRHVSIMFIDGDTPTYKQLLARLNDKFVSKLNSGMIFSDPLLALLYTSALLIKEKKMASLTYQNRLSDLNALLQDIQ